jgi:hypothetical protein
MKKELAIVALIYDWYLRDEKRTLLKHVPSGFRNVLYKYAFHRIDFNQIENNLLSCFRFLNIIIPF